MLRYIDIPPLEQALYNQLFDEILNYWDTFTPLPIFMFETCYEQDKGVTHFVERQSIDFISNRHSKMLDEFIKDTTSYFKDCPLTFGLVLMKNPGLTASVRFPPHSDFKRELGINILFENGGDNVVTETYTVDGSEPSLHLRKYGVSYWNHNDLKIESSEVLSNNRWHLFNAGKAHGVSNIETKRSTLIINIPENTPYFNFDYQKEIKDAII
jgi:hypothetical protein